LLGEVKSLDFREKAPGLWLPSRQEVVTYNLDEDPPEYRGKVSALQSNTLLESRFNDLPDSFFQVPVPDRATVHDYLRGLTYEKYPPGTDPLRASLELARTEGGDPVHRSWWEVALITGIGAGLVLLVFQGWRWWRRPVKGPADVAAAATPRAKARAAT
jgi:hypothetical protein